jgi:hypothetical protein
VIGELLPIFPSVKLSMTGFTNGSNICHHVRASRRKRYNMMDLQKQCSIIKFVAEFTTGLTTSTGALHSPRGDRWASVVGLCHRVSFSWSNLPSGRMFERAAHPKLVRTLHPEFGIRCRL